MVLVKGNCVSVMKDKFSVNFEGSGVLGGFIEHMTVHAASLRDQAEAQRICPDLRKKNPPRVKRRARAEEIDPNRSDPNNISWIDVFDQAHISRLPAWRELHIYNILGERLDTSIDTCICPLAHVRDCICHKCECQCPKVPNFAISRDMSSPEVEDHRSTMMARLRIALPRGDSVSSWSEYHACTTIIVLLMSGVEVVFHDEISVSVEIDSDSTLHKGHWHTTYRLKPPQDATKPFDPPLHLAEPLWLGRRNIRSLPTVWSQQHLPAGVSMNVSALEQYASFRQYSVRGSKATTPFLAESRQRDHKALPALTQFEAGICVDPTDAENFDLVLIRKSQNDELFRAEQKKRQL